jgi:hypothetical protein
MSLYTLMNNSHDEVRHLSQDKAAVLQMGAGRFCTDVHQLVLSLLKRLVGVSTWFNIRLVTTEGENVKDSRVQ